MTSFRPPHQWMRNSVIATGLLLGATCSVQAAVPNDYQCVGTPINVVNIMFTPPDTLSTGEKSTSPVVDAGPGPIECGCSGSSSGNTLYISSQASAPNPSGSYGGWLRLNDDMEAQVVYTRYQGGTYYNEGLPQPPKPTEQGGIVCPPDGSIALTSGRSGRDGKVTLRLRKDIIGMSSFSGELGRIFLARTGTTNLDFNSPVTIINGEINVRADASCKLRAGDTISVDLGPIPKVSLTEGGLPSGGYTPRSIDLSVDCTNMYSGVSAINYMIQSASGADGNVLLTDLSGLGILLRDGDGNAVGLGESSVFSVPLNSDSTSYILKPYPTKLPGQTVESGNYTAQAIVTLTLP